MRRVGVKRSVDDLFCGGSGPPLLYLHSAAGEALIWTDVLNGLAEDRTVIAPAHPGFWDSQGLETIHDIEDLAIHYLAFMDARGWEQVDVMGTSLGGWIAMEVASRWPERVGRMVLAASVGIRIPGVPMADVFAVTLGKEEDARAMSFHDPKHPLAKMANAGRRRPGQLPQGDGGDRQGGVEPLHARPPPGEHAAAGERRHPPDLGTVGQGGPGGLRQAPGRADPAGAYGRVRGVRPQHHAREARGGAGGGARPPARGRRGGCIGPRTPVSSRSWDAATYERASDIQEAWALAILDRLPLRGDETVLDAGCGPGQGSCRRRG